MPTSDFPMIRRQVTIYLGSEFGFGRKKVEASAYGTLVRPYAQYARAVELRWLPRGKRKVRGIVQTSQPDAVIVSGWGHPNAPSGFSTPVTQTIGGVSITTSASRHASFAPEHDEEFDAWFARHFTPSDVIADFRGHNSSY